ncbi:hypothetical protein NA78x_005637 [Anatilimnocola sp. NA78]|uniref:hypothetical protein n=1 Tax=Anatilimnocola sp. NA78 TaxID=3415683 RepID=UPI003CE595DB
MSSQELRPWGWALVGLLCLGVVLATIFKPRPKKPLEPLPQEMDQLRAANELQQPELLKKIKRRLLKEDPASQVVVVQGAPTAPPVVTWNVDFDSDDEVEEATHWPAPWPAVVKAMSQPISSPKTVHGKYHGGDYHHRLVPLDDSGLRVLLVNSTAPRPSWWSLRNLLAVSTVVLTIAMLLSGGGDDDERTSRAKKR